MRLVAEEQHIDYHFKGLEEDDGETEDEDDVAHEDDGHYDNSYIGHDDGELSFDYGRTGYAEVDKSTSRHSMEVNIYLCHAKGTLSICLHSYFRC